MLSHGIFTQVLLLISTGVVQCHCCMMNILFIQWGQDTLVCSYGFKATVWSVAVLPRVWVCRMDLCPSYIVTVLSLATASLRRSFRLRKDRQSSSTESSTPDANHTDFLIYEEVAQYLPRPGERPRLVVLIGRTCFGALTVKHARNWRWNISWFVVTGSLGARITELKQKAIAEKPHRYGLAVPRESPCLLYQYYYYY